MKVKTPNWFFIIGLFAVVVVVGIAVFITNGATLFQGYLSTNPIATIPNISIRPLPIRYGLCYNADCDGKLPDYVIITRPLFLNTIQDFIKWKQDNGFKVGVLTVDYIHSTLKKANPSQSIREKIKSMAANNLIAKLGSVKYFLLIGDTTATNSDSFPYNPQFMYDLNLGWNVPSGYYCRNDLMYKLKDYGQCVEVTDLYYADFNDSDWTENQDGYIMRGIYTYDHWYNGTQFNQYLPNQNDPNSLIHEPRILKFNTIVARIPIRDPAEFKNIFNKIKLYQPTTSLDMFENITLAETTADFNSQCSFQSVSLDALAEKVNNCANSNTAVRTLFKLKGYPVNWKIFDLKDPAQKTEVTNSVINTTSILFALFHGSHGGIELGGNPPVYQYDLAANFKNIFPAWIVTSCSIGSYPFYNDDSFSETMLKAAKGPAFVLQPTNNYWFFKESLEGKTVGEAFYNVGKTMVRYTSDSNILFGDPSLRILGTTK